MPGTGSARLDETLWLTAEAEGLGADAVLVITPYYSRPSQQGLYDWFSTVAAEFSSLPIVIYNVPVRTAVDIAPETVGRLRRATTTSWDQGDDPRLRARLVRPARMRPGLPRLLRDRAALLPDAHARRRRPPELRREHLAPAGRRSLRPFAAGRHDEALALHYALHPLVDLAFVEVNPVPVKWAMEQLGLLPSGYVRPPLASPTEESQARMTAVMAEAGLLPGAA